LGFTLNESMVHWPGRLQEALQHLETILTEAVLRGQSFRLLMLL
jgi:hypothetical protein